MVGRLHAAHLLIHAAAIHEEVFVHLERRLHRSVRVDLSHDVLLLQVQEGLANRQIERLRKTEIISASIQMNACFYVRSKGAYFLVAG